MDSDDLPVCITQVHTGSECTYVLIHILTYRQPPENATVCSGEQQLIFLLLLLSYAAVFSWLS